MNDPWDVLESLAQTRFASGEEPFAESLKLDGVARGADLVPLGSVCAQVTDARSERLLARGSGWTALVKRWRNGSAEVAVTAAHPEALAKCVADIRARAPIHQTRPETVEVDFWYAAGRCPEHVARQVDVPEWGEIAVNYPLAVRQQLDVLMAMTSPPAGGRLLLWHGPPGTGKTTAIRALLRAWSTWCRPLFVVDAERFLGHAGYMMSVVLGGEEYDDEDDEREDDRPHWRLLLFEDADELLRSDAKRESGQSLSRLLNLSDGFIGQGVKVLVLITTNEAIGRLHPAVARAGRCLANVEFGALSAKQAAALIGGQAPPPARDLTLAEVFERKGDLHRVASRGADKPATGQYL